MSGSYQLPSRIVSGGQTGVDRAAFDFAITRGVPQGGWVPAGRMAEDGPLPARYAVRETPSTAVEERTEWNTRDSDATLIVTGGPLEAGSLYTQEMAQKYGRPRLHVDLGRIGPEEAARAVREWLEATRPAVLNVAGPRASSDPGIYGEVLEILWRVFPRKDPFPVGDFLSGPTRAFGQPLCRLGLASHGRTEMTPDDVLHALDRGVNFLNWPGLADSSGGEDAFSDAVSSLGPKRASVVVCVQFGARTARDSADELRTILSTLRTDYVDVLTLYYVEMPEEWEVLSAPGGVVEYLRDAQRDGAVRRLGITSHQRVLAAAVARSAMIDSLMIRYNAAHRGAEQEVFPVTDALRMPVIAYTALRWGALLQPTRDDPPGFIVPRAPDWYQFVLQSPSVAVTLAAPHSRAELDQDLEVLRATGPLPVTEYDRLAGHGDRVRRHSRDFP